MRKIIYLTLVLTTIICFGQSKLTLPFIGTRSFSFCEGNACASAITINKNGACTIKTHGFFGDSTTEYVGTYKSILWINESGKRSFGYKIISSNAIAMVDLNGKIKEDCFDDEELCTTVLYKW